MSAKQLTPQMIQRTLHVIDSTGVVDLLVPAREPGTRGRVGAGRDNVRLLLIGMHLCTRLGHETTVRSVHQVLTESIDRQTQWDLGILRPLTTKQPAAAGRRPAASYDPDAPVMVVAGKPRKRIWGADGVEEIGYDDLYNATVALRARWDYGHGSAPNLSPAEREQRQQVIEKVVDALITVTTIARPGATWALDATGQWVWSRGPEKRKKAMEKQIKNGKAPDQPDDDDDESFETTEIATDDDGNTAPAAAPQPPPASARGKCMDAAWGYKTSKMGGKEVGYGFHQHTIVRVPDPDAPSYGEPLLVDGFILTPANADVVQASLRLIDRIQSRHSVKRLVGDLLYTNLRADRWAVPLAKRGIEQGLRMRTDSHKVVDINGALMQHGWMHCPSAPMDERPMPLDRGTTEEWNEVFQATDAFKSHWAFDRKESGLGPNPTSKWVCPARAGRVGCPAAGQISVQVATELDLPIITPPTDWATRKACTNKSMDFTPDPTRNDQQRKLMQREYVASKRWARLNFRRSLVEGAFGILKNASRQRLRRGQNRLPGLAMASIIVAIKVSVFNEDQVRIWDNRTGLGPADHPLLQPDPPYWGFANLSKEDAKTIDARNLHQLRERQLKLVA